MTRDPESLVQAAVAASEIEAEAMVQALEAKGIRAAPFGSLLGQLRAEVPTPGVAVMVRATDLDAARSVLRDLKAERVDVNWDEVDVGELEDGASDGPAAAAAPGSPSAWRSPSARVLVAVFVCSFALLAIPVLAVAGAFGMVLSFLGLAVALLAHRAKG
ncbi:MAG: hypothetical protein JNM07_09260 [Phycisphaerae bacterium]|nr:hypothetical protein [Phycisphaerae bacterium]